MKRLRIFAGPNGAGKSTLYDYLLNIHAFNEYYKINPDIIAKELPIALNLTNWKIDFSQDELRNFLKNTSFQEQNTKPLFEMVSVSDNQNHHFLILLLPKRKMTLCFSAIEYRSGLTNIF